MFDQIHRLTDEEMIEKYPWATNGKPEGKERSIITSLDLDPHKQEKHNLHLQAKYSEIEEKEVSYEMLALRRC